MWLALCDPSDGPGLWCIAGLRRLGLEPLEILLPAELVTGTLVTYRVGGAGGEGARLQLQDGRTIHGDALRGVLNRLPGLPTGPWAQLAPGDREYVAEELNSMLAGLLGALRCPVLNPADPVSLGGSRRTLAEWRVLAAAAGLEPSSLRMTSRPHADAPSPPGAQERRHANVVGSHVFGAPAHLHDACRALAARAGAPLLGLAFTVGEDERWRFDRAFLQPDLRPSGRPALAALATALGAGQ